MNKILTIHPATIVVGTTIGASVPTILALIRTLSYWALYVSERNLIADAASYAAVIGPGKNRQNKNVIAYVCNVDSFSPTKYAAAT